MATTSQYILKESAISALINALFSIVFVFIIFYPNPHIAVFGVDGLVVDALPQSLAITFMATLIPTLITRSRKRKGVITQSPEQLSWLPNNAVLRALILAIVIALIAAAGHFAVFSLLAIESLSFGAAAITKVIYGAMLGALITRYTLSLLFSTRA